MAKGEEPGKPKLYYVAIGEQGFDYDNRNPIDSSHSAWEDCLLLTLYLHL